MHELSGSIVPLVTPMNHDGDIDFVSLNKLLSWHEQATTSAVIVLGSTGEGTLLSEEERMRVIDFVVNEADSSLPTWVGVSNVNPQNVIRSIEQAAKLGADGAMLASPMYVKPTQEGIISYFTHIADHSDLSILMYNVPSRTGSIIDVPTACVLSHHEKIIGIKECDITLDRMAQYQDAFHEFDVFCGDDSNMLMCLANGGAGVISVISNLLPELVSVVCQLSHKESHHKAQAIDSRWQVFLNALTALPNPAAIKWAMSQKGQISPFTRMPLSPLTFSQEQLLQEGVSDLAPLMEFNPDYI